MIGRAARVAAAILSLAPAFAATAGAQVVAVAQDPTAATTAIEFWYRAPSAGYDLKSPGIARLALAAIAASKIAGGSSLSEIVNKFGGSLTLAVYPDIAMVGASVPASDAPVVFRAMSSAYFTDSITSAGMKAAVQDSGIVAAEEHADSARTLQDLLFTQLFTQGPAHYAPLPEAPAFTKLAQSDVRLFALRAFRSDNAIVALAGNIDQSLLHPFRLKTIMHAQSAGNGLPDPPYDSTKTTQAGETSVSGSETGLGFAWAGPPISDTRAATAMDFVADYLFDSEHGTLPLALRSQPKLFVSGQFITLHDPGVLVVTISGDAAAGLRQSVLDAVAKLQQPMDAAAFAAARTAFVYHILSQIQTPIERADNFGWYAAEGNLPYAPGDSSGTYVSLADSLDPQFVAQIVRAYLQQPIIVRLFSNTSGGSAT